MTQRELIDYCNALELYCRRCQHRKECDKYRCENGNIPFHADALHPEQYEEEEI